MSGYAFDAKYLAYFKERVATATDGTRVPGDDVIDHFVATMQIREGQRVLDVGCSWGRMLPLLQKYTAEVFGLDMTYDVVDEAAKVPYRAVIRGAGEDTNFPSAWFDHAILFGVFDCCEQERALAETARILKPGGLALITGKNIEYCADDRAALIAERNAKRKSFPNSFTDVAFMWSRLADFGFEGVTLARFERRGDLGERKLMRPEQQGPFYEFLCIVRRVEGQPSCAAVRPRIAQRISATAETMARSAGKADSEAFLRALAD